MSRIWASSSRPLAWTCPALTYVVPRNDEGSSVSVIVPLGKAFELVGAARNLFNVQYADPASDQHVQDVIPQNGRTWRVGLRWRFGAK